MHNHKNQNTFRQYITPIEFPLMEANLQFQYHL